MTKPLLELVKRLSELKASAANKHFNKGLAIGSDQVAVFNNQILGKPHNKQNAVKQLSLFSGTHCNIFNWAVCLRYCNWL